MDETTIMFIAGVVILTASLILHLRKRLREEAKRKAEQKAKADAVREAERKRQVQSGQPLKPSAVKNGRHSTRIPLAEAHETVFNGSASPRSIAKWEAEIHQIGRQMIGQIDSKMIALQTLTLDANRAANRLELLIEHLERMLQQQGLVKNSYNPVDEPQVENDREDQNDNPFVAEEMDEDTVPKRKTSLLNEVRNLITDTGTDFSATNFADLLDDLEDETERLNHESESDYRETAAPAQILKVSDLPLDTERQQKILQEVSVESSHKPELTATHRLPSSIALTMASPILSEPFQKSPPARPDNSAATSAASIGPDPLALSSPGLPGSEPTEAAVLPAHRYSTARQKAPSGGARRQSGGLSIDSLYDNSPNRRGDVFTPSESNAAIRSGQVPKNAPTAPATQNSSRNGSRLELRKQVEMLADYGYTANQIAQNLNITLGEVDLMLSLRTV